MGLWITELGDPWRPTIFGPYSLQAGNYWNCSTNSTCGNFTDNILLKNPDWTLIGEWHHLPESCLLARDCPSGSTVGYGWVPPFVIVNGHNITIQRRAPPAMENSSVWTSVRLVGGNIVNFNSSKPWGYDTPMPICVFPFSGSYGSTQRVWFYISLVLSMSDVFPEFLRLVSLGNVITTSLAAGVQLLQLYPYRPSVTKIVDLDSIAAAHILAITMWATAFWVINSLVFGERLLYALV